MLGCILSIHLYSSFGWSHPKVIRHLGVPSEGMVPSHRCRQLCEGLCLPFVQIEVYVAKWLAFLPFAATTVSLQLLNKTHTPELPFRLFSRVVSRGGNILRRPRANQSALISWTGLTLPFSQYVPPRGLHDNRPPVTGYCCGSWSVG